MAGKSIEYSNGGLTKRHTAGGWRWAAQVKWRYVGETKWRTRLHVLVDEDGEPIMTDARRIDPKTKKDKNRRNIRTATTAYNKWYDSLSKVERVEGATVDEYVTNHIDTLARQAEAARKKGHKEPHSKSTLRGYREYVPIIKKGFDGITIARLDSADVYRWVEGMKDSGMAASTMRKAFSILSGACDRAVSNGIIAANPCTMENRRRISKVSLTEPNALAPAEIERLNRLLDSAKNPRLRIGARIALLCGLRAGEVCGLRWCDVDEDGCTLHVRESIANAGGGTDRKEPKSRAGKRDVPLPRPLACELAAWREVQASAWTDASEGQEGEVTPFDECRVIGYADGSWFTPNSLGHLWNRLANGRHDRDQKDRRRLADGWVPGHEPIVGITGKQIRLHDLRHTFATYHIATGTDVVRTATLMGHADPAVTMRRYAGRLKDTAIVESISGKSAMDVLASGTEWASLAE